MGLLLSGQLFLSIVKSLLENKYISMFFGQYKKMRAWKFSKIVAALSPHVMSGKVRAVDGILVTS